MKNLIKTAFFAGAFGCFATTGLAEDVETFLTGYCKAEELDDAQCDCVQTTFAEQTAKMAPDETLAAAFFMGQAGLTPQQMMTALQSIDQTQLQTVLFKLDPVFTAVEETCAKPAEAAVAGLDLSGTPRERMIALCEQGMEFPNVCDCMADQMLEKMGPQVFEFLVDIRTAEAMGAEDGFAKAAEDRGLTKEEAEQALQQMSGPIMSSAGAIMSCMPEEMQQMMNGGFQGMMPLPEQ